MRLILKEEVTEKEVIVVLKKVDNFIYVRTSDGWNLLRLSPGGIELAVNICPKLGFNNMDKYRSLKVIGTF